jgi:RNA polymerase-binding transcription factor DksA
MVLRTRHPETKSNFSINPSGPVGAPKASYVKEVLLTLRTRLEPQLQANEDHDLAMVRALQSNIQGQLEQVNEALARIEEGKYGICTECLRPIENERLVVRPYSTLCMDCQNRRDRSRLARS